MMKTSIDWHSDSIRLQLSIAISSAMNSNLLLNYLQVDNSLKIQLISDLLVHLFSKPKQKQMNSFDSNENLLEFQRKTAAI